MVITAIVAALVVVIAGYGAVLWYATRPHTLADSERQRAAYERSLLP